MQRLLLKALTVTLGYSLIGQSLRMLYPFFFNQVLIVGALLFLVSASVACLVYDKLPRPEFYILIFWAVVGLVVGIGV